MHLTTTRSVIIVLTIFSICFLFHREARAHPSFYTYFEGELSLEKKQLLLKECEASFAKNKADDTLYAMRAIITLYYVKEAPSADGLDSVRRITTELEKRLDKNPANSFLHVAYAIISVEVSKLSPIKRLFAKWFYGGVPEGLSMETALLHLLKAKLNIRCWLPMIYYWIAEAYFGIHNKSYALWALKVAAGEIPMSEKNSPKVFLDDYYKNEAIKKLVSYNAH